MCDQRTTIQFQRVGTGVVEIQGQLVSRKCYGSDQRLRSLLCTYYYCKAGITRHCKVFLRPAYGLYIAGSDVLGKHCCVAIIWPSCVSEVVGFSKVRKYIGISDDLVPFDFHCDVMLGKWPGR